MAGEMKVEENGGGAVLADGLWGRHWAVAAPLRRDRGRSYKNLRFASPIRRSKCYGMFVRTVLVVAALTAVLGGGSARADCTDAAAPGVDWRRCYMDRRDFSNRDLSGARLRDATFARANLSGTDFSEVDGYRVKFYTATMRNAKFDRARLAEADFSKANLTGASFKNANLRRAKFFDTILRDADLSGAKMRGADLFNADLSGATWIDGKKVCAEGSIGQCN